MFKKEGPGWRIIRDLSREKFSTLIGGKKWAIELTEPEWEALIKVVFYLFNQYQEIKSQLMGDEDITLEFTSKPWLAILKGDQYGWGLTLILTSDVPMNRGAEVYWERDVTDSVVEAMRTMWDSCYL